MLGPVAIRAISSSRTDGREVGEGALAPVIPAVGNAIYDAVGVRMFEVPMTPDRVLKAIEAKKRAEAKGGE